MKPVRAIYQNGVFRPTEPVELPEGAAVEVGLPATDAVTGAAPATAAEAADEEDRERALDELYEILSNRFDSGEHDVAARHDEYPP